ncbi:hypothetical protein B0H10DRAFT_2216580 [Mycena sp. CBHHK59/15]|nr:hypothetical protein B0H10DRAFT_2216580 [Mycena sp. CBHHK59/15]
MPCRIVGAIPGANFALGVPAHHIAHPVLLCVCHAAPSPHIEPPATLTMPPKFVGKILAVIFASGACCAPPTASAAPTPASMMAALVHCPPCAFRPPPCALPLFGSHALLAIFAWRLVRRPPPAFAAHASAVGPRTRGSQRTACVPTVAVNRMGSQFLTGVWDFVVSTHLPRLIGTRMVAIGIGTRVVLALAMGMGMGMGLGDGDGGGG